MRSPFPGATVLFQIKNLFFKPNLLLRGLEKGRVHLGKAKGGANRGSPGPETPPWSPQTSV